MEKDRDFINYKPLYFHLFNGITDINSRMEKEELTDKFVGYISDLKNLQIETEEMYIEQ